MTGLWYLDWAVMAVSLFNTIVLLWLGLTVLLNAERRGEWGIWLAGGGLLLGGAFFVSHSAIMGHGLRDMSVGMNFWWYLGWVPVASLPLAWYVVMLWYAGFWDAPDAPIHRRHRIPFALSVVLGIALVGVILFADPLPSYWQVPQVDLASTPGIGSTMLLVVLYPVYAVMCMGLSLDAVRRPGPTGRVMGDLARHRARPWLFATSLALLMVSLLVAAAMYWFVADARDRTFSNVYSGLEGRVALFDLVISSLIAVANVLLGQAVVSYEIFTGKTLPRRGLLRQWRSAVILAAGYSTILGLSLARQWHPMNGLLIATTLMTVFYALFSWRSYFERDRYIEHLRPFVTSQRLYEDLLSSPSALHAGDDAAAPFRALCRDVLGVRVAYLAALGPLSPLVGPPLTYPGGEVALPPLVELASQLTSPKAMCVAVDPERYGDAMWAVPLWSERGLIGVLLLGEKHDGGLFAQEEIEIARASGERLIDTRASAEMAQRLMSLQRQRLSESQVLDRQARRVLHDDVLPLLHTAMLGLSRRGSEVGDGRTVPSDGDDARDGLELLAEAHRRISNLLREMPTLATPEVSKLGLVGALKMAVEEELGSAFDDVTWQIEPEGESRARAVPPLTAEVLYYAAREAIRNAARYGRDGDSARPLHLRIRVDYTAGLEIAIEDDGAGFDGSARPNNGGSGQGLALHSTMMAVVGGSLAAESVPGKYTRVLLTLPQGR